MTVRFPLWLLALLGVAAIIQVLVLQQGWTANPFARTPLGDAEVYWNWAGQIADGRLQGETPFLSAPLYPYFLGLLRWLGAGLPGVYAAQTLLHLATIALIADLGRRRFGPTTGVLAGFSYLLLDDPTYYVGRALNVTLQLLTVALLMWQAVRILEQRTPRREALFGVLLGLSVLANPTMMLAVPIFAAWIVWGAGRDWAGGLRVLLLAVVSIAPATWHNHRASGEWILVSAQAGVAFRLGNAPGAQGVYTPLPGVSANRNFQNRDAFDLAAEATGEKTWRGVNRFFFREGVRYLMEDPARALVLEGRKFWWFFTGRGYGDLYVPELERRHGFASRLALSPLALAWFLPVAVVGLWLEGRRNGIRGVLPDALLLLLPLLVVMVFWYSPRYRMPAAPVAMLLAARAISVALWGGDDDRPAAPSWKIAVAALLATGMVSGPINRIRAFDDPGLLEPAFLFLSGDALRLEGRLDEAEPFLKEAIADGFDTFESRYGYSQMLLERGGQLSRSADRGEQARGLELYILAVAELEASLRHQPLHLEARENFANLVYFFWERRAVSGGDAVRALQGAIDVARQIGAAGAAARLQGRLRTVLDAAAEEPSPSAPSVDAQDRP